MKLTTLYALDFMQRGVKFFVAIKSGQFSIEIFEVIIVTTFFETQIYFDGYTSAADARNNAISFP
jgi:hypothetical protein